MHGRLKIKTTTEKEKEKQEEREKKKVAYEKAIGELFKKRSECVYDEDVLKLTSHILMSNPDVSTVWNYRREVLLHLKGELPASDDEVLKQELSFTEACLQKNPKSYCCWHHRSWAMGQMMIPPWNEEIKTCNYYLKNDARNFHCWDYRRFLVSGSKLGAQEELKYSEELIRNNFSNFSAWHYRSKLLLLLHPPETELLPLSEAVLVQEVKLVTQALFTDPSDQSPWFYLRWLISRKPQKLGRIYRLCFWRSEDSNCGLLLCAFNQPVNMCAVPEVEIDGTVAVCDWYSPSSEPYAYIWKTQLSLGRDESHSVECRFRENVSHTLCVTPSETIVNIVLEDNSSETSCLMKDTLDEIRHNCMEIDSIEPNNKWVLLSLLNVCWTLNVREHAEICLTSLNKLEDIDSIRTSYYRDMKSKLQMELKLQDLKEERTNSFSASGLCLSRLSSLHCLFHIPVLDFSNNAIVSTQGMCNLVLCRKLNLDNNDIKDLSPLVHLSFLEELSAQGNQIASKQSLVPLKKLKRLGYLNVRGNPCCSDNYDDVTEIFPHTLVVR